MTEPPDSAGGPLEQASPVAPAVPPGAKGHRGRWIAAGVALVLVIGAVVAYATTRGPGTDPISLEVVDGTSASNALPATFSLSLAGATPIYPQFAAHRVRVVLPSAVRAGSTTTIVLQLGGAVRIRLRVPAKADTSHATGLLVLNDRSATLTALGVRAKSPRLDRFLDEYFRVNGRIIALGTRYFDPGDKAYRAVFGGGGEALRSVIFVAIRDKTYPLYEKGQKRADNLSSSDPLVQAYVTAWIACIDDTTSAYSAEEVADDPSDVFLIATLDTESKQADAKANASCATSTSKWNQLAQEAGHP